MLFILKIPETIKKISPMVTDTRRNGGQTQANLMIARFLLSKAFVTEAKRQELAAGCRTGFYRLSGMQKSWSKPINDFETFRQKRHYLINTRTRSGLSLMKVATGQRSRPADDGRSQAGSGPGFSNRPPIVRKTGWSKKTAYWPLRPKKLKTASQAAGDD